MQNDVELRAVNRTYICELWQGFDLHKSKEKDSIF
jgi:hypothetical protein